VFQKAFFLLLLRLCLLLIVFFDCVRCSFAFCARKFSGFSQFFFIFRLLNDRETHTGALRVERERTHTRSGQTNTKAAGNDLLSRSGLKKAEFGCKRIRCFFFLVYSNARSRSLDRRDSNRQLILVRKLKKRWGLWGSGVTGLLGNCTRGRF
jgi:hypothetical protein